MPPKKSKAAGAKASAERGKSLERSTTFQGSPGSTQTTQRSTSRSGVGLSSDEEQSIPSRRSVKHPKSNAKKSKRKTVMRSEGASPEPDLPPEPLRDEEMLRFVAAQAGAGGSTRVDTMYQMLRSGEDCEQRTSAGLTPLGAAAATGNAELVALLLEKRADAGVVDCSGEEELPLHYAARHGHAAVIRLLAEPTAALGMLDFPNGAGRTPLHIAVQSGHIDAVRALLLVRADAGAGNKSHGGDTALHLAARRCDADVLEELLDYAPEGTVNATNALGEAPLHFSVRTASRPCVALLLRYRGDANKQSLSGDTPFDAAKREAAKNPLGMAAVLSLVTSYARSAPTPLRTDSRFDR